MTPVSKMNWKLRDVPIMHVFVQLSGFGREEVNISYSQLSQYLAARDFSYSVRTLKNRVEPLIEQGYLTRHHYSGQSCTYTVNIEGLPKKFLPVDDALVAQLQAQAEVVDEQVTSQKFKDLQEENERLRSVIADLMLERKGLQRAAVNSPPEINSESAEVLNKSRNKFDGDTPSVLRPVGEQPDVCSACGCLRGYSRKRTTSRRLLVLKKWKR